MNDINAFCESLRIGSRYDISTKLIKWSEEYYCEDIKAGKTRNMVTFEVFSAIASSLHSCLNFTYDIPSFHDNNKVPMLDIQVYDDRCTCGSKLIRHEFYEKDTASKKVIDYRSAMPIRQKIPTLSQDIIRKSKYTGCFSL